MAFTGLRFLNHQFLWEKIWKAGNELTIVPLYYTFVQNLIVLIIIIMSSIVVVWIAIDVYLWLESSHQANAGRGTLYSCSLLPHPHYMYWSS